MPDNKRTKKMDLTITVILLIGILAVVNFFSNSIFMRWDLTQGKIYSISDASKKAVSGLDDIVSIKAYFSENLPPAFMNQRQEVADMLNEYRAYSGGKIKVSFIDPKENESLEREAYMQGIQQLTFEIRERDEMKLMNGYMGIAISYGANTEVIPALKSGTKNLEYQITSAIKKVTSEKMASIAYLASHGTKGSEEIGSVMSELESLYPLRSFGFSEEAKEVPADVDTLIIVSPDGIFSEEEFKAMNSFLKRGGGLFALVDGVKIGDGLTASAPRGNFGEFLEKYGFKVNNDLVLDPGSNGVATFQQGFFPFSVNYPFWPIINNERMNKEFSAVSELDGVMLPWASSIEILEDVAKGKAVKLAVTTDKSWTQKDRFDILPTSNFAPTGSTGEHVLAAALFGDIEDPYGQGEEKELTPAKIVVVGDSDFINDGFVRGYAGNSNFFYNLVDSLSLDESLMGIRSKGVANRSIDKDLSPSGKTAVKYANILGITVLVLLFGMFRYYIRRKSRFVDDL